MAVTVSASRQRGGPSAGALIRIAAIASALGIALSITDDYGGLGKWFAIAGVFLLILALHRFGRLGPDTALKFEDAPARQKKKKKRPPGIDA